jgi:hypothetical protein
MLKRILPVSIGVLLAGALIWFFAHPSATVQAHKEEKAARKAARAVIENPSSQAPSKAADRPMKADEGEPEASNEDVVVNLGKVEDIGRQASSMMISRKELAALRKMDASERTPEQNQRLLALEREAATALGLLPEISGFQDNPDEYSRFFGSLIKEAAGLDDSQSAVISAYMKTRAQQMVAGGINAANEPTDPAAEKQWEDRRDDFNKDTAKGVASLLPDGEAKRIGFTAGFLELMEKDFDKAD